MKKRQNYQEALGHLPSLGPANKNLDAAIDGLMKELKQKIKDAMPMYNPVGTFGRVRNWWKDNVRRGEAIRQGREFAPTDPRYIYGHEADFDGGYDKAAANADAALAARQKKKNMWSKLGQQQEAAESAEMPLELWNLCNELNNVIKSINEAGESPVHPVDDPNSDGGFNSRHYHQRPEAPKMNPQQELGTYLVQFKQKLKDLVTQYRSNRYSTHGIRDLDGWTEPQRPPGGGTNPEWDHWAREHWFKHSDRASGYQYVPGAEKYAELRKSGVDKSQANQEVELSLRGQQQPQQSQSQPPQPQPQQAPQQQPQPQPQQAPPEPEPKPAATSATSQPPKQGGEKIGKTEDEINQLLDFDPETIDDKDAEDRVRKLVPNLEDDIDLAGVEPNDWQVVLNHMKSADTSDPDDLKEKALEIIRFYTMSGTPDGMKDHYNYRERLKSLTLDNYQPQPVAHKWKGLKTSEKIQYFKNLMGE